MSATIDLKQLVIDRTSSTPPGKRGRQALVSRYIIPGAVLFGFFALIGWTTQDLFFSAKPVSVVPVLVTRADVQQSGAPLFQAAGWVEPRPTPVLIPALTEGIIEKLLVVEGQAIQSGDPVARLIDADARLALEQARTEVALRESELTRAKAVLNTAQLRLNSPVHLGAALAEAESQFVKTESELARLPFLLQSAKARLKFARESLTGRQAAGDAIAPRLLQQSQSEHDNTAAELSELEQRQPRLQQEVEALRRKKQALAQQRELLIDESGQVAEAQALVQSAEARLRQSQLAVEVSQLRLDRMVIKSPMTGRVLSIVASPGSRVMGTDPLAEHKSSTVVSLYDPALLQVRADVRLEDVPLVQPGQVVRIETPSVKNSIEGRVLNATSRANVQKNTLEVKVAILAPPPTLRPEMLVSTTFYAPERPQSESETSQQPERLLVPRQLVESMRENPTVWVADPAGVARRKKVRLGPAGTGELVEVSDGLRPTDRLISAGRETLSDGDRIRIVGEDPNLGTSN